MKGACPSAQNDKIIDAHWMQKKIKSKSDWISSQQHVVLSVKRRSYSMHASETLFILVHFVQKYFFFDLLQKIEKNEKKNLIIQVSLNAIHAIYFTWYHLPLCIV